MLRSRIQSGWSAAGRKYHEYPRSFWALIAGSFIDRLGTNLVMPFLSVYLIGRFNVGMTQVGLVLTIFAVAGVGGSLFAGAMADKIGRRAVLAIGLIGGGLSRVGLGLAPDMGTMYVVAIFAGFFGTIGWPAQAAMLADLLPEHQRADGFSLQRVFGNITWVLGPLLGGVLAPVIGYVLLFVLDAISSVAMAIIVFAIIPETRPERAGGAGSESFTQSIAGYGLVLRDSVFTVFMLISILMMAAYVQMYSALSVFLVHDRNMPASFFGLLLMVNAGMVVVLQFPITRWTAKRPPLLVMIAGTALYLVGLSAYGLVTGSALFIAAMAVISLGEMLVMPTGQALVALLSPQDMRARYAAIYGFIWFVPQSLAPLGAGLIMDNLNPTWVWYACGLLCAVSIAGFWALHARTGARIAEQAEAERVGMAGEAALAK